MLQTLTYILQCRALIWTNCCWDYKQLHWAQVTDVLELEPSQQELSNAGGTPSWGGGGRQGGGGRGRRKMFTP